MLSLFNASFTAEAYFASVSDFPVFHFVNQEENNILVYVYASEILDVWRLRRITLWVGFWEFLFCFTSVKVQLCFYPGYQIYRTDTYHDQFVEMAFMVQMEGYITCSQSIMLP